MFDKIKEDVRELLTGATPENDLRCRLHADHEEIARLLSALLASPDRDLGAQEDLRDQLILALTVHLRAEEDVVYRALSKRPGTAGLVLHSAREHDGIELQLGELRLTNAGRPELKRCVTRLREAVTRHVHDEENELLPQAERELGRDPLAALIPTFDARRIALTQEQSSAPSTVSSWDAVSESTTHG